MKIGLYFACLVSACFALPDFQSRIPNGDNIPHPCFINSQWKGVGHKNPDGGGFLNPFGEDFRTNEFTWNECLCEADSDGDGKTNGEELGDPQCVWTAGEVPDTAMGLSHPGVCEPTSAPHCQQYNDWQVCEPIGFTCEGMDDPETFTEEKLFKEIEIPSDETSYWCTVVTFDNSTELHGFAMEPVLVNVDLVHHIDMYECQPGPESEKALANPGPTACGAMSGCSGVMLAAWQLGINGICLNSNVGIRFGKGGALVAELRIHYHNPFNKEAERDASGIRFHLTPNLREHDAGVLNLGNFYLEIPPHQTEWEQTLQCSELCTDSFQDTIYLSFGAMHMHYLGKGGYSELWRDGQKVQDIMIQDFYDYNAPHLENFHPPIEVHRGDTIKHACRFNSMDRTDTVYRGQAATEEMCHIYFVHYPLQNLTTCFNKGQIESCGYGFHGDERNLNLDCDRNEFDQIYTDYLQEAVYDVCDGSSVNNTCLAGCAEVVEWAESNHTCLQDHNRDYMISTKADEFRNMMNSCKDYPISAPEIHTTPRPLACESLDQGLPGTASLPPTLSTLLYIAFCGVVALDVV